MVRVGTCCCVSGGALKHSVHFVCGERVCGRAAGISDDHDPSTTVGDGGVECWGLLGFPSMGDKQGMRAARVHVETTRSTFTLSALRLFPRLLGNNGDGRSLLTQGGVLLCRSVGRRGLGGGRPSRW